MGLYFFIGQSIDHHLIVTIIYDNSRIILLLIHLHNYENTYQTKYKMIIFKIVINITIKSLLYCFIIYFGKQNECIKQVRVYV